MLAAHSSALNLTLERSLNLAHNSLAHLLANEGWEESQLS
jgi:hypothetical protein